MVALIGWFIWTSRRVWLVKEAKRNETQAPPSENQLRWDIRHMREDIGNKKARLPGLFYFINSLIKAA